MKFKDRLKKAIGIIRNKSSSMDETSLLDFLGIDTNKEKAISEATYFACLIVLSESVGKLPLKLLRHQDNNGISTERSHPLYSILHDRPNPYMTATSFWSTVEQNRNHYGNAYCYIKGAGSKLSLWILPSNEVEIWYDDKQILSDVPDIHYIYSHSGKIYDFKSEEILHFKTSNTFDGIKGISVREQLKMTIEGNIKAQKLLNSMYKSGFTAKAVIQYTSDLSEDNLKKFKNKIEKFAGTDIDDKETNMIIPLPVGTTLTPLNIKLTDNQFIEVKKYSSIQIASAFGIKPNQIGDYEKSSYASAEAQQLSFYVETLLYIIKQYEEELNYKLLSKEELTQGISNFLYTPNEARALLDMEAKPGGDKLIGNGATISVDLVGKQYVKPQEEGGK